MDLDSMWQCEGCGLVYEGVSPPDTCSMCDHEYFESVADLMNEKRARGEVLDS